MNSSEDLERLIYTIWRDTAELSRINVELINTAQKRDLLTAQRNLQDILERLEKP